jgi:hypothetical protein
MAAIMCVIAASTSTDLFLREQRRRFLPSNAFTVSQHLPQTNLAHLRLQSAHGSRLKMGWKLPGQDLYILVL